MNNTTINRNFSGSDQYSEDSFIGCLHEDHLWNKDEYQLLEDAITEITNLPNKEAALVNYAFPVWKISSYISLLFGCHFNEKDGFRIKNLCDSEIHFLIGRTQAVFTEFFAMAR